MLNLIEVRCASIFALVLLAAACTREPPAVPAQTAAAEPAAQVAWAREALERNPDLEVLATDPKGIFTVRLRHGGELRTIRMDDLIAAPPDTASQAVIPESVPGEAEAESTTAVPEPSPEITVTRAAGNVSITGPGVSIATARAPSSGAVAPTTAALESPPANVERRGQPLVCQGGRLMHVDGRTIEFEGDGLVVEDGCDLYLTNSHISAGGTAITVSRGKVHIVNSTIKGGRSSIEASLGAQVFVSSASIDGLQRRFDTAQITDLGGNRYR
ncbi:MAG TPA: hypothetical protein PLK05_12620 [Steroidobacteraceae bacterium]|nr:hypothetical protein [Steroidobacteraceae bacterium]